MLQNREFASAVAVRLGLASSCILGGFVGYWISATITPGEQSVLSWPTGGGAAIGFVLALVVLTWLAKSHRGAGVVAGALLTAAAAATLGILFATRNSG